MAKTEFDRFVEKQHKLAEPSIDFEKVKEEWLASIEALYAKVEEFLSEYKSGGRVRTTYNPVILNEDLFGTYQAQQLTIIIGNKQIILRPLGRFTIGAMGRVDVTGSSGNARIVRTFQSVTGIKVTVTVHEGTTHKKENKQPEVKEPIVWKLVTSPPNLQYLELTKERFLETLVEVSNG